MLAARMVSRIGSAAPCCGYSVRCKHGCASDVPAYRWNNRKVRRIKLFSCRLLSDGSSSLHTIRAEYKPRQRIGLAQRNVITAVSVSPASVPAPMFLHHVASWVFSKIKPIFLRVHHGVFILIGLLVNGNSPYAYTPALERIWQRCGKSDYRGWELLLAFQYPVCRSRPQAC